MFLVKSFFLFLRNSLGTINNPYTTFREISVSSKYLSQILFIHLLVFFYFLSSSVLKTGLHNPFLLTVKFNSLYISSLLGFLLMTGLFLLGFKLINHQKFPTSRIIILWSYSLWPTLYWFFFTSLMYIILPPPRTFSYPGKLYSLFYLALSLTLLLWKIILYYLTLRFGLRLDLYKIILISAIIFPVITVFSFIMYELSIFKIPFI